MVRAFDEDLGVILLQLASTDCEGVANAIRNYSIIIITFTQLLVIDKPLDRELLQLEISVQFTSEGEAFTLFAVELRIKLNNEFGT